MAHLNGLATFLSDDEQVDAQVKSQLQSQLKASEELKTAEAQLQRCQRILLPVFILSAVLALITTLVTVHVEMRDNVELFIGFGVGLLALGTWLLLWRVGGIGQWNTMAKWGVFSSWTMIVVAFAFIFTNSHIIYGAIFPTVIALGFGIFLTISSGTCRKRIDGIVNNLVNQKAFYQTYFEHRYDNVKLLDVADHPITQEFYKFRGVDVPSDATISRDYGGIAIMLNKHQVYARRVQWHWIRQIYNGRTTTTQNIYKDKFYLGCPDLEARWAGFELTFSHSGIFHKGKDLENEQFDKMFACKNNDPIKLRVLFTPFIQETLVNKLPHTIASSSIELNVLNGQLIFVKSLEGTTPFEINYRTSDMRRFFDAIFEDMLSDVKYVEESLQTIATFRELLD